MWGFLAGLTYGFRQRRPWEGWWGAFTRACNVLAFFFVLLALLALFLTLYDSWWVEPRSKARAERVQECMLSQMVPVPVTYPGGPTMMIPEEVATRCENEVR